METQTDRLTETDKENRTEHCYWNRTSNTHFYGRNTPAILWTEQLWFLHDHNGTEQFIPGIQCTTVPHLKPSPPHYSALVTQYPGHCRLRYTLTAVSLEPENRTHFTDNTQKCFFGTSYHLKYVLHFKIKTYKIIQMS